MKSQRINFNEHKIYLSTETQKEEDEIKNIIDLDFKIKTRHWESSQYYRLYKTKCHNNISELKKMSN